MNLPYLAGSLAGVALLVALCAMLFGTKGARIATAHGVEVYLAQVRPVFRARAIALAEDGRCALAENDADGAIHLVVARGDSFVTRLLSRMLLRAVKRDGATLSLRLADFTLPRATLMLGDPAAAALWEKKLVGMVR